MHGPGAPSHESDLGDFLRTRRAALDPRRVGLADDGRPRRVSGLRREELSQLANVSVDYIVRLEQGRTRRVSGPVLDALADALQLTPDDRAYLATLAEVARTTPTRAPAKPQVTRRFGNCSTTCTTSRRSSSTAAWTYWAGTLARPRC
jgi:transcriptional regulator with XRE-family HTH domain